MAPSNLKKERLEAPKMGVLMYYQVVGVGRAGW